MNIKDKLVWIFLPSSALIIIGFLSINFPDFFKTDGGYTNIHKLPVFVSRLFLYIFWGKTMGILLIVAGVILFAYFIKELFTKEKIIPADVVIKQQVTTLALSKAFKFGKKRLKKLQIKSND
jgi:multisubunit Na+/H+ antiporter MnhG subunit